MSRPGRGPDGTEQAAFGDWLRRERESRGIPLVDVAQRTRIKLQYLEAIEASRTDELPAEVFVRGFVRAYARAIGADEKTASEMLSRHLAERGGGSLITEGRVRVRGLALGGRLGLVVGAVLVAVAIVIAILLVARR